MNFRHALIAITLATGLGACASTPDYGLRYQDGSYYSPASEGRGDYYVGADYRRSYYAYDEFDLFFGRGYGGWYGSPFYGYGGYCSVRYRYCPRWAWGSGFGAPFGETGFQLYFGSPWDPYWGRGDYPYPYPYSYPRRPHRGSRPPDSPRASADRPDSMPAPFPSDARRPLPRVQPRPDPLSEGDRGDFPVPSTNSGRRSAPARRPDSSPAPRPRPKSDRSDGSDGN